MDRYRNLLLFILSFIVFVVVLSLGANYWIAKQLPVIINEENDSPYQITFKNLEVSFLNRSLVATDIVLVPKKSMESEATRSGIYAKVKSVQIRRFKIIDLIFTDKLIAHSIQINRPEVILYKHDHKIMNDPKSISSKVVAPFSKIILVSEVDVTQADFKILYVTNNEQILHINNASVSINGIVITDDVLEQKIPFGFDEYQIRFDSIYYRAGDIYDARAGELNFSNDSLSLANISYLPRVSRNTFVQNIPMEKDLFTVKAGKLHIDSIDWGYRDDKFYFHSKTVLLEAAAANIYRPKMPPDDPSKKHLYSKQLRDIPFDLHIDKFVMRNATVQYEEEKSDEAGPGLLSFNGFNMSAYNIDSGFGKKKVPDVEIDIACQFMNVSKMNVRWTFNVLNKSDAFNIRGSIFKFPAEELTPFIKPYMNITADGMLDKIYFNFSGNDNGAAGDFALEYEDLKVNILQKDREKKNKFLSAIANIFVKKDTKERLKETPVDVKRNQDRSFFNLLWISVQDGLKKLLL